VALIEFIRLLVALVWAAAVRWFGMEIHETILDLLDA
jgi:hypothetical protein